MTYRHVLLSWLKPSKVIPLLQLLQPHKLPQGHSVTSLLLTGSQGVRAHSRQQVPIILEGSCLLNVSLLLRFPGISNTIEGVFMSPSQELVNHFFLLLQMSIS